MTKLIVLAIALLTVSLYATSTKRICGNDGLNYNSYAEIAYGDRAHMGYCGEGTQPEGANCVKNVANDCAADLTCKSLEAHPCEGVQCAGGEVCVAGTCRDASLNCAYCKTNQLCRGGVCQTDCNLTCKGTCDEDNECRSNVGVCAGAGSDNGVGNDDCGGCGCSTLTSSNNPVSVMFAFMALFAIILVSRRKAQK